MLFNVLSVPAFLIYSATQFKPDFRKISASVEDVKDIGVWQFLWKQEV